MSVYERGIYIHGVDASGNLIQGNFIGIDTSGTRKGTIYREGVRIDRFSE